MASWHEGIVRSQPSRGAPISATEKAPVVWYRTLSPADARRSETDDVMTAAPAPEPSATSTTTGSDVAPFAVANSTSGATSLGARVAQVHVCLLYTSPSPRDGLLSRMPSSA